MQIADYIASNKKRICDEWMERVESRYAPDLDRSQLLNHLPAFIDEIVGAIRAGSRSRMETAERHGRDRVAQGTDIGISDSAEAYADRRDEERVRTKAEALAADALQNVRGCADEVGIEIAVEVEPFEIEADSKLVTSALTNLLTNAMKFTKAADAGHPARPTRRRPRAFEVEDRCGGLGPQPERHFDPFVQRNVNKTGFGLVLMSFRASHHPFDPLVGVISTTDPRHVVCTRVLRGDGPDSQRRAPFFRPPSGMEMR